MGYEDEHGVQLNNIANELGEANRLKRLELKEIRKRGEIIKGEFIHDISDEDLVDQA